MSDIKIHYMRDNHTFLPLSLDVDEALRQIQNEWRLGYTCGSLVSKSENMPPIVHSHGKTVEDWWKFNDAVRDYYSKIQK